jgi:hypothetical protein
MKFVAIHHQYILLRSFDFTLVSFILKAILLKDLNAVLVYLAECSPKRKIHLIKVVVIHKTNV